MKVLGIIPARFASSRFPGKPLVDIAGKSMIRRVYEQAKQCKQLTEVVVATDDERIFNHVSSFGKAVMTSPLHESGTDRCAEVLAIISDDFDYVVNIQGDEPFISPNQIKLLIDTVVENKSPLGTLVKKIENEETLFNTNTPKVLFSTQGNALCFSRETIPHLRGINKEQWLANHVFYKHIGIYAYRADVLSEIVKLPLGNLEQAEKLEQLRWLENRYDIRVGITEEDSIGIDMPEDLEKIKGFL